MAKIECRLLTDKKQEDLTKNEVRNACCSRESK